MDNKQKKLLPESRTYTVEEIAALLNIGRTTAYQLVKEGHFKTIRIGSAIRISRKSFDKWFEQTSEQNSIFGTPQTLFCGVPCCSKCSSSFPSNMRRLSDLRFSALYTKDSLHCFIFNFAHKGKNWDVVSEIQQITMYFSRSLCGKIRPFYHRYLLPWPAWLLIDLIFILVGKIRAYLRGPD